MTNTNLLKMKAAVEEELNYEKITSGEGFKELEKDVLENMLKPLIGEPKQDAKVIHDFYEYMHTYVDLLQCIFYKNYIKPISEEAILSELIKKI